MNSNVPREIAHVYAAVERAKKFSVLPRPFTARTRSGMDEYVDACTGLLRASSEASVHALEWFHDNPRFSENHAALEASLSHVLETRAAYGGVLPRDAPKQDIELLWSRHGLEGILRCAVLLRFEAVPATIGTLFSVCSGPYAVQGANQAYRSVAAIAKKAASRGEVALLFRADEVEIFASPSDLAALFVKAYQECSD